MMKKKGFTLVELLAVIAILAILVIIALPAVLTMFNKAKVDTFVNEARTLYRTAESQYMADSINGEVPSKYSYPCSDSTCKSLEMSNAGFSSYEIIFTDGKVTKFDAVGRQFNIQATGTELNPILVEQLGDTYSANKN